MSSCICLQHSPRWVIWAIRVAAHDDSIGITNTHTLSSANYLYRRAAIEAKQRAAANTTFSILKRFLSLIKIKIKHMHFGLFDWRSYGNGHIYNYICICVYIYEPASSGTRVCRIHNIENNNGNSTWLIFSFCNQCLVLRKLSSARSSEYWMHLWDPTTSFAILSARFADILTILGFFSLIFTKF